MVGWAGSNNILVLAEIQYLGSGSCINTYVLSGLQLVPSPSGPPLLSRLISDKNMAKMKVNSQESVVKMRVP